MWGGTPTPYGPCSFCHDLYHHVRNCPSIRQISNNIFGHKNTLLSRPRNDNYFDSYNPTWSQQSNLSWQAQFLGNPTLQFHDHSYSYLYQYYQEEPPSPIMVALKETMVASVEASARLERTMSAFLNEAEEDRKEFARINNSITQSYEKMDAHFKQMMDILKEEKCQRQLVASPNEYYMENECIYYHERTTTTPRDEETVEENICEPSLEDPGGEGFSQFCEQAVALKSKEVVTNQVDERKKEQTEDPEEPHQEKEESTERSSTLALIPEIQRVRERILLELPIEQIEDIKIEK
jgi:hypothetical protein